MRRRPPAGREPTDSAPSLFDGSIADDEFLEQAIEVFPGASPRSAIAVSTLTQTVKDVVEGAFIPLWVRGEISDFKPHRNGHWYFALRDHSSQLRCVVWSRDQRGFPAAPDDGMQVTALGQIGVYASRGEMQFTVRRMEAEGDGLRRKALEAARARLEADGLLAPSRKRELPRFPRYVAIVTSGSGAALRDVIAVLRRRAPGVQLVVAHAAVQGESAPRELCAALQRVARWGLADLVIIARGGGSREDLWAFNHERVARALAASPVPTISAVGHEIDTSLCDLVADLRAPTPSAAAEAAAMSRSEIHLTVRNLHRCLVQAIGDRLDDQRARTDRARRHLGVLTSAHVRSRNERVGALAGRLNALSPLATLERGFAVARDENGRTLASVADFTPKRRFSLRVRDGDVEAVARSVAPLEQVNR
ncbi:MAG: exodeoxyribonuclease VII large subunit [Gemmatimonadota bacterium]|nr:exodeoxyribonuclease VII large subunit [Gemmatimonadota bacterium]